MTINELSPEQEKLVKENIGYAEGVARQTAVKLPIGEKYGIPMDMEDCIQTGLLGLIQAAKRFDSSNYDPEKGTLSTLFRSYAYNRIRGAVIDEVRKQTFVRRRGLEHGLKFQMLSMDYETSDGEGTFIFDVGIRDDPAEWIAVIDALDVLDDKEIQIVMGFMIGMTGKELAEKFEITESRVSQIAQLARSKMKEAMT